MKYEENTYRSTRFLNYINLLEWFDYSVYLYFASLIAIKFFPIDHKWSLVVGLSTISASLLVRPLGGLVLNMVSDKISVNKILMLTPIAMLLPTILVGILPSYQHIGPWSAVLLLSSRLLQGIASGAQYTGSLVSAGVLTKPAHRGFSLSLIFSTATVGFILATLLCALVKMLLPQALWLSWGWRIPFWLCASAILLLPVFYKQLKHAQLPLAIKSTESSSAGSTDMQSMIKSMILGVLLAFVGGNLYYTIFIYLFHYQLAELHYFNQQHGMLLNALSLLVLSLAVPLFGWLSDLYGRKSILFFSNLLMLIACFLLLSMLLSGSIAFVTAILILSLLGGMYIGPISAVYFELYHSYRFTKTGLIYNIGTAASGSLTLLILPLTIHWHQSDVGLLIWLGGSVLLGLCCLYWLPETAADHRAIWPKK